MTGQRPRDPNRWGSITLKSGDGAPERIIYKGPAAWPEPAASFGPDACARILAKTRLPLRLAVIRQPAFWTDVERLCRWFASAMQNDLTPAPSARQVRDARHHAKNLQTALRPFLDHHVGPLQSHLYGALQVFVEHLDRFYEPRSTRPRRTAGGIFVPHMGQAYKAAFRRAPSEGPADPFARFVLACLDETQGLPELYAGDWVRKQVRHYKRQYPTSRTADPWAPFLRLTWDEPNENGAHSSASGESS